MMVIVTWQEEKRGEDEQRNEIIKLSEGHILLVLLYERGSEEEVTIKRRGAECRMNIERD